MQERCGEGEGRVFQAREQPVHTPQKCKDFQSGRRAGRKGESTRATEQSEASRDFQAEECCDLTPLPQDHPGHSEGRRGAGKQTTNVPAKAKQNSSCREGELSQNIPEV